MAIADKLTKLTTDITNAYDAIDDKGGTIPVNKNTDNLENAIRSIETGITPTGTLSVTENGTYNVTNYASADVNVSGGEILDLSSYIKFKNALDDFVNEFVMLLQNKVSSYSPYINNEITLYSPDATCFNYILHKRSNNKYRIIWGTAGYACVKDNTTVGFLNKYFFSNGNRSIRFEGIIDFNFEASGGTYYYSNEFDTVEQIIAEISKPNGNITYTPWSSGALFGAIMDEPYEITCSNLPIFDMRNNYELLNSRRISQNENYEVKS